MKRKKIDWPFWLWCTLLSICGVFLKFALVGYSFSALICFCLVALIVCYKLLRMAKNRFPKASRVLRRCLTVCVCIGLTIAAVTCGFILSASFGSPDADCDYVVVLGAGVHGTVPSLSLHNRLDAAYDYLTAHPKAVCVVSGGQGPGEDITEAECMYRVLTGRGIDQSRIWMEDQATSTEENLFYSLAMIEERTGVRPQSIGIISSEYHLLRASLFARDQGVQSVGIPAKTSILTLRINYTLREIAAVWHHLVFGGS